MKRCFLFVISLFFLLTAASQTRPQFSGWTGYRCVNCHANAQGGGQRDFLGAYSRNETSLIPFRKIQPMKKAYQTASDYRSFGADKIYWGFDYRFQTARLGSPSHSEREFFGMQAGPYLTVAPLNWLTFDGGYNFVESLYPSQQSWFASVKIQPTDRYPELRVGFFRPAIGVRYDDHTLLIRRKLGRGGAGQLIPPYYAEYGAQLNYFSFKPLTISAGVFGTESLSEQKLSNSFGETVALAASDKLAYLGKVSMNGKLSDTKFNGEVGASYFGAGDFSIISVFSRLGITNEAVLVFETALIDKRDIFTANNFLIELTVFSIDPAFTPFARFETAKTDDETIPGGDLTIKANQYVLGANVYLAPLIELRPEYRIFDRVEADSYQSQWAVQLHVYF